MIMAAWKVWKSFRNDVPIYRVGISRGKNNIEYAGDWDEDQEKAIKLAEELNSMEMENG